MQRKQDTSSTRQGQHQNASRLPKSVVIEGEVLGEAVIDARDMAYMNFARQEHAKLAKILLRFVIPAMGGYQNPMASDIARHLEQIQTFSSNYCWTHRRLGASHGVVGEIAVDGGVV
ncbi:hypothetical protein G1E_09602 [Pseudomonas sp. TJI-51]|uniref:hypothetical protein n=1 Tax=unclassified Pseudomonas TaxID=196821 RepID=UPI0001FB8F2D|nr:MULTISPECIES: hypothetical protein [unclassified Pseudomonas]EGB99161.1 hypothetical protein G1E_09602 [Pseudomonas sp. TJI-51]